jgi:Cu/Ag efflux pump CusA
MWVVRLALRRALSVAVMALLMLVLGVLSFAMMNVDIFPAINLPVVISSLEPLNSLRRSQSLLVASAQVRAGSA